MAYRMEGFRMSRHPSFRRPTITDHAPKWQFNGAGPLHILATLGRPSTQAVCGAITNRVESNPPTHTGPCTACLRTN